MYRVQWRGVTPKGAPGKFGLLEGLTVDDATEQVKKLMPTVCWLYVQRDDVDFPGKSETAESLAAKRAKKGRK